MVDAITGNFLDSATYTKPYGWETNMTRQNATIANYVNGSYVAVPYEDAGAPDYGALSDGWSCSASSVPPESTKSCHL